MEGACYASGLNSGSSPRELNDHIARVKHTVYVSQDVTYLPLPGDSTSTYQLVSWPSTVTAEAHAVAVAATAGVSSTSRHRQNCDVMAGLKKCMISERRRKVLEQASSPFDRSGILTIHRGLSPSPHPPSSSPSHPPPHFLPPVSL